jgi:hypothetical protein
VACAKEIVEGAELWLAKDGGGGSGCSLIVDKVLVDRLAKDGGGATRGGAPAMYATSSPSLKLGVQVRTTGSGILGIWDADVE